MNEVAQLRVELGEVRDLAEAALMAIVGADKVPTYTNVAGARSVIRRQDRGTPLHNLFGGDLLDRLSWKHHGIGAETVEELVRRVPREELAAIPGVGPAKMEKVDAIVADRGLRWAEAVA